MPEKKTASAPPIHSVQRKRKSIFLELLKYLVIAFIIMLPVRLLVIEPFVVSGSSMSPTFNDGNYLVINKLAYEHAGPQRGDVIVFRYPLDPSLYFIKRVVGLPGETVEVEGNVVSITESDGTRHVLDGSHLADGSIDNSGTPPEPIITTLASDEYFVLGDNRDASSDSRDWGPLQAKFIIGEAFARVFPLSEMGILPGHEASSSVE